MQVLSLILGVVVGQVSQAATLTWDTISGDGGTITGGSGTWTDGLGNWNTGSGDATWNNATPDSAIFGATAGTVTLGGAVTVGNMVFNSGYTLAGGGNTLTLSNSTITANATATISAALGGSTGLSKDGTGTLTLSGANTYTGATTISGGVLQLGDGGTSGSLGSGSVVNNAGFVVNRSDGITIANAISGTGSFTQAGAGTTTITGSMSYSGNTSVSAGKLQAGAAFVFSTHSPVQVESGAVLALNGFNNVIGTLSGTGTVENGTATTATLTTGGTVDSSFDGIIQNGGSASLALSKTGTNTLTLSGTNTYTGGTLVSNGVLSVSLLANGGLASSIGASSSAASVLALNGGTLSYTGAVVSTDRLFSVTTAGGALDASGTGAVNFSNTGSMGFNSQSGARTLTLTGTNTGNNTLAAAIGDNGGATSLTKSGVGTWVLAGSNSYSGTTTISDGVLQIGSGGTSGTLGSGAVTDNGNLTFNRSSTITVANTISGSGSVSQIGTGTTTLSGTNSYTGVTTISGGVLNVTTLANGGSNSNIGASSNAAENLVLNGGTLRYSFGAGAAVSTDRLFSVGTSGGTIDASGGFNINFTNTGSMGFNGQSGARTLTLTGNNANENMLAAVIGDNGGATSVTKTGNGIWALTGANTYTGVTTVSGTAVLKVTTLANGGSASSIGASSSDASNLVFNGGTFTYAGGTVSTDRLFSLGTSGITLNVFGTGGVTFTNTGSMGFVGTGARTLTLANSNGGASTIAAVIGDNGGATSVTHTASFSTWVLTGANTYTGATTINGGVLSVTSLANGGSASGIGAASSAATNLVLNGGKLLYTGAGSSTDRLFSVGSSGGTLDSSGTGAVNFTNTGSMGFNSQTGTRTLTLTGTNTGANTLAAAIGDNSGATAVAKTGVGTWVLTGTNSYTGATTINGGVLQVGNGGTSGTLGSGAVTDNGNLTFNRSDNITVANTISGSGSVTQAGAGTTTLSGANSYVGATTISGGVLSVATLANGNVASNIGASSGAATNLVLNGGALRYTGVGVSTDRLFSVGTGGGTLEASGTGALSLTNAGSMGFNSQSGARTLTLTGTNTGSNLLAAVIGDSGGATALTKAGAGAWTLTGSNSYTGATTINGGVLNVTSLANGGSSSNIGASSNAASNLVLNGGTLQYNNATTTSTDRLFSVGAAGGTISLPVAATLNFTNTGNIGFNGETGARTLTFAFSNSTFGGIISLASGLGDNGGATSVVKSNTFGTLRLTSDNNTYTGTTTINGGAVAIGNLGGSTGSIGTGEIIINSGGTLVLSRSGSVNLAQTISGAGGVTSNGNTMLTLSGTNTYTGVTRIISNGGVVTVSDLGNGGVASSIGASSSAAGNLSITNLGTLRYVGTGASTDRLFEVPTGTANPVATIESSGSGALVFTNTGAMGFGSSTGARTLVLGGTNTQNNTMNPSIGDNSGATALTKAGTGTWVLAGTNTYTGVTTISGGVLTVTSLANGGSSSNIGASSNAATNLVLNGGKLLYTGAGSSTDRLFSVGSSGGTLDSSGTGAVNFTNAGSMGFNSQTGARTLTLTGTNTGSNTLATAIGDNGGATALVKTGAGTWVLAGANTYTGLTTISGGVLQVGNGGTSGTLGSGAVTDNGNLTFNRSDSLTVANAISGSGSVTQAGAGTTTLSGTNSYTGATVISAGVLNVTSLANGGSNSNLGASSNVATNLVLNGGTLRYTGGSAASIDRLFSVGTSGGTLDSSGVVLSFTNTGSMGFNGQSGARTLTLTGTNGAGNVLAAVIGDSGGATSLIKSGTGTWMLTGNNTYTGLTTISGGTLILGNFGSTGSISGDILDNGTLMLNNTAGLTLSQTISGTGGVTVNAGSHTLSGANTYTGVTSIAGGLTLSVATLADGGAASNLGAASNAATNIVLNNGILKYTGAGSSTDRLFGIGTLGGTLNASGTGAVNFTNTDSMGFNSQTGARTLTLTGTNTGANTLAAAIGDNGGATSLTKSGVGTWVLTGANNYTGTTTISTGVLQVGSGGTAGTLGSGAVTDNANLTFKRSDTVTISNSISGTGSLTQAGTGTTILTGANSYAGVTTISGGVLQVGNGGTSGTLGSGAVTDNGNLTFNRSDSLTVANAISGSGSVTQAGAGTTTLSGTNSYLGVTTISGGVLNVTTLANGGSNSNIGASSNAASNLVLNGGTLQYNNTTTTSTDRLLSVGAAGGTISLPVAGTLTFTNTGSLGFNGQSGARTLTFAFSNSTFGGVIIMASGISDNGGATSVVKSNTLGTVRLTSDNNTYTGTTTISGALSIGTFGGSTGSIGTGEIIINSGGTLVVSRSGSVNLAQTISGAGGVTSNGNTMLTLSGTNTYTGVTRIISNGGIVTVSDLGNGGVPSSIGASSSAADNLLITTFGTLRYVGAGASTDRLFSVTGGSSAAGTIDASGTGPLVFTNTGAMGFASSTGTRLLTLSGTNTQNNTMTPVIGDNSGATSLTKSGTGTWVLAGSNTYTGVTTISGGVLQVGNGGTTGTLGTGAVTDNAALVINRSDAVTLANTISGTGTFTQAGAGTTTFTGSKSYTGATFINAGKLQAGGANTFSNASAVTVASGAVLEVNGFNNSIGGLAGSGTVQNGTATFASLNVLGSATSTFSGIIQDGGSAFLGINKGGIGGTLTLTGSNTYTGGTVVSAGVLSIATLANGGVASNIGASSNIASSLLLNGGTLRYTGSAVSTDRLFSVTTVGGALDASGTGTVSFTNTGSMGFNFQSGARTLTLTGTGGGAIAAVIGDNGGATSLTKTGAGQWTLSGASGYTGATTISGGQLLVSSLANGGSASSIGAATNIAANLVINGGVLQYTGAAVSTDRLFSVGTSGGTIDASGTGAVNFTNTGSMGFNGQSGARTLILNGNNTSNNTLAAVIGDNGGATSLIKLASSTWVLTGANTYTGSTRIDLGMLIVSSLANGGVASNIGASSSAASNLILGLSTFKYMGDATSTDRLFSVGTSGGTIDASGTGAVNFTNTGNMGFNGESGTRVLFLQGSNTGNNTIAAIIGDNGGATSIYKNGIGLWVLSGADTYTGINLINSGTLSVAQLANGGSASNLGASTNAATNLVLNGGALKYTGAVASTDRLFSVGTSGGKLDASGAGAVNFSNTGSMGFNSQSGARTLTLTGTNAGNNTLAAAIGDNGGATSLVKSGTGTWVLTGTNTYTGTTTISAGVLRVGNGGTSGTLGTGAVTDNGNLTINHSDAITLANSISGSGSFTQAGSGTTTLTGANSYTGSTTISAGVLSVASIANGGSSSNIGASTNAAINLVLNGGVLQYTGAAASTDRLFSVGTSGGTVDASGTGAVNFTNTGSMGFNSQSGTRTLTLTGTNTGNNTLAAGVGDNGGATSLVKSGAGTWVLTGTNNYAGTTTINAGVLQIGSGSTTGSLGSGAVVNNGSLVVNRSDAITLANTMSGSGSFTQAGAGTTTLSGANSYTGATTINAGVLNVTFLANGGSNSNIGAATNTAENLVINGGMLQYSGAADVSTDRLFSVGIGSAVIDVTGSGALNFTNTGSMGFNGESGDRNLLLTGTNSGVNTIAAAIGDFGGATSVSIDGSATWLLTGANTYTGATTVSSGVLQIGGSNLDSAIILGLHATLELNGINARIGSLAGSGTVQNNSVDAATLTTGGNNTSTTFSGVIQDGGAGALSIVKTGSGTFTLTGANTYTGTTTISAGVLQVGSGGTTGTLGSGAVTNNASLIINRSDALTIVNDISGSGSLTQAGSGTTTLTGDNSYSGSTTINAGVLSVAVLADGGSNSHLGASTNEAANLVLNGGALQYTGGDVSTDRLFSVGTNGGTLDASGTGALSFTNTGGMGFNGQSGIRTLTLTGTNTGDNTLAAVIGDNGGATALTKSGMGTWVLTGNNSNSGITMISAGVLQIGAGGTTGSLGSGAVTDNGSLIINRSDAITIANAISGSGSFTHMGSGSTTLTGDNGYTGGTTINAGVLSVAVLADGGSSSNLGASTNEATNLVLNGGTLKYTGADVSTDRLFSVGTNGGTIDASGTGAVNFTSTGSMDFNGQSGARTLTLTGTNTGSNTLAAVIGDNGGETAMAKSGAGTWVLTGANSYTGTTSISAGELQVGAGGATGALGTGVVTNNARLVINRSDALTIANTISGSGSLTQAGAGTTTLTGDNGYIGSTTINAGVLSVAVLADGGASSNVGASTHAAANLVLNGGALQYTGGAASTDRLFSVGSNGGTLDASGTGAVNFTNTGSMGFNGQSGIRTLILTGTNTGGNTLAAVLSDNEGATVLTKSGAGTWVLTGANSYTGTTTISEGTLQIGDGGTTGSLSASSALSNNGSLAFNRTDAVTQGTDFASMISGSGGVTQAGSGTLTLNGDNTYTGATNIRAGTLEVTRNNALGTGDAGTTVSSGATLLLNNVNYSTSEALALNGSGAGVGGALRNSGTSSYTGAITAETNASINAGGGILNLTGGLVKNGTVLTITGGGTVNVSGTGISGASASSDLVVDGTTLVVSADSDYNGPTTVQNAATLIANASVTTTQLDLSSDSLLAGTGSITTAVDKSMFINGTFSVGDPGVGATATNFALTTSGSGAVVMGAGSVIQLDLFTGAGVGNNTGNVTAADSINLHGQIDATAGGTVVIGNPNGMTGFHGGDQWQLVHLNTGDANAGGFISTLALNDSSLHLASGVTSFLDQSTGVFSIIDTNGGLALAAVEGQALINGASTVTGDLNGHLFNLRSGGGEEGDDSGSITAALDDGVIVGEGDGDPKKASPIAKRVARSRQWEVFATVNYGNVKLNPIRTQSGVQVDSWASGVGTERHFSRGLTLGFAASFLQSDQGYTGNAGSLHLEGPALSSYASYVRGSFWNSLLYSFGTYQMDSIRNPGVPFPTAFGTTRTYTHSVQYNAGWNMRFQNDTLVTGPFAGVDYLHGSVDAYNETGGGLAALHYSAQSYQSLVSRVGWSASKQIKASFATITPQVRLSYERQNIKNNNGASVSLINVPFSATGGNQAPGQDYLVAGLGVSLAFTDRFSLMLSYQGQFFRHDMQAHFGSIRFSYQF